MLSKILEIIQLKIQLMPKKKLYMYAAASLIFIILIVSLFSCGGSSLDGTYVSVSNKNAKIVFDGDTITMSVYGVPLSGTYSIKGGKLYITANVFGEKSETESTFSKSGNTIIVDGEKFEKK